MRLAWIFLLDNAQVRACVSQVFMIPDRRGFNGRASRASHDLVGFLDRGGVVGPFQTCWQNLLVDLARGHLIYVLKSAPDS